MILNKVIVSLCLTLSFSLFLIGLTECLLCEFSRLDDLWHWFFLLCFQVAIVLLFEQQWLHLASLVLDFFSLLDNRISPGHIRIGLLESHNRVEFLTIVLLVEVHAVGEHLFNIANFDSHVWWQLTTVNLDNRRVNVEETPDPDVLHQVLEVATGLPMEWLVFLDGEHLDV